MTKTLKKNSSAAWDSSYCADHISGDSPQVAAFPVTFYAESTSLGGTIPDAEALYELPMLSDRLPVTAILAQIAAYASTPAGKVIMLRVNAPYSVLAGLVEQPLFYRWLAKESEAVHAGLERVTGGLARYIRAGFERGVRIISIADPFANPAILGEKRCCDFACVWLSKLLEKIAPIPGLVTHICPQSSLLLEQHGFVTAAPFPTREANAEHSTLYLDFLINIVEEAKSAILGHQCIYAQETAQMVHLRLTGN